jgi:hypothetical protein
VLLALSFPASSVAVLALFGKTILRAVALVHRHADRFDGRQSNARIAILETGHQGLFNRAIRVVASTTDHPQVFEGFDLLWCEVFRHLDFGRDLERLRHFRR